MNRHLKLPIALAALVLTATSTAATFRTPTFVLALNDDSQTMTSLSPVSDRDFDFLPVKREPQRRGNGHVHLGDLNLRLRSAGGDWQDFSTYGKRASVRALPRGDDLAAADISATLAGDAKLPLTVERRWSQQARALALTFTLTNRSDTAVEIGGLGIPLPFDNILTDRSLQQAHAQASFADPSIANDAGYVQVTRLTGQGPALLVLPEKNAPLEAWRPLLDDALKRGHTFEGFFEWMSASRGYAEREWAKAGTPWNPPTSVTLAPGQSHEVRLRFVLSPTIRAIETTLIAERRPVAIGFPGYVLPTDVEGSLFLSSPLAIERMEVTPAGALSLSAAGVVNGWRKFSVRGQTWGRSRLEIRYTDGSRQTVSYFVTRPAAQVVSDLAAFTLDKQFFDEKSDPFGRAPAILSYDRDAGKLLTQDTRVWISGMSDEGGAGAWIAAISKQLDNPKASEVALLERVVNETIVGKLQVAEGKQAGGVKKSLFWYDAKAFPNYYDRSADWSTWTSWSKKASDDLGRSYNYPHVAIGHWILYRLARHHQNLVSQHDWRWYLEKAALTSIAMTREAPHYAQFGQMEGEVFLEILLDLQREGMTKEADALRAVMKKRMDHWLTLPYPFGSEMPWDSTGQPEVYAWLRHFGKQAKADTTREVILGYDPVMPSWGYNGNARRYWDFLYGGKIRRVERQIHHYGSTLNAVPLFDAFRANPADLHLLRVAYGGLLGGITNVDEQGFGSAAFHSWPDEMRFDAITGDYGMGFFGHAYATASYLVEHPVFGWLGFGGNVSQHEGVLRLVPNDSARARVFIAPAKLWVNLAAGKIESVDYSPADGSVTLRLAPANPHTPAAKLLIEGTAGRGPVPAPTGATSEHGWLRIALGPQSTLVKIPGSS